MDEIRMVSMRAYDASCVPMYNEDSGVFTVHHEYEGYFMSTHDANLSFHGEELDCQGSILGQPGPPGGVSEELVAQVCLSDLPGCSTKCIGFHNVFRNNFHWSLDESLRN